MSIDGKVIAITGASSGIGEATARLLAARGGKTVLGARGDVRLSEVATSLTAAGYDVAQLPIDVRDKNELQAFVDFAVGRFGRLDALVACAGIGQIAPIDSLAVDDWDDMIDVNLRGVLYGIAAALPVFDRQGSGHFVTVISTAGLKIAPNQVVYAGTKNAVRTIMEGLRQELKGRFRVTGVSPGFVRTNFADSMRDLEVAAQIRERMDAIAISPDAVARAIAFAIEQPDDVDVGDIVVRPTVQDSGWPRTRNSMSPVVSGGFIQLPPQPRPFPTPPMPTIVGGKRHSRAVFQFLDLVRFVSFQLTRCP